MESGKKYKCDGEQEQKGRTEVRDVGQKL